MKSSSRARKKRTSGNSKRLEQIQSRWITDWTAPQLSKLFKVPPRTIRNWARRHGLKYLPMDLSAVRREDRMQRRKLRLRQIKARWKSGLTSGQLSRMFGVGKHRIYIWSKKYGLRYVSSSTQRRLSKDQILALWKSDWTARQLSPIFKVTPTTIREWARKYGLKYLPGGRRRNVFGLGRYVVRRSRQRGLEITIPKAVATRWGIKVGDLLQFTLTSDCCVLKKVNGKRNHKNNSNGISE